MIVLLHLPEDGIVTGHPLNGMYITGALPGIGERILVRTCDNHAARYATVIEVDAGRNLYRAKIDN